MAFLDNNNDNRYTNSDPLEDLDRELADLRKTLDSLDEDVLPTDETDHKAVTHEDHADTAATSEDDQPLEENTPDDDPDTDEPEPVPDEKEPEAEETLPKLTQHTAPRTRSSPGKKWIPIVIIAILLIIAAVAAVVYLTHRNQPVEDDSDSVTIYDSEMGEIEIDPVEGAQVNTYTQDNLTKDENGFPAYYEDGKKISHLGVDLSVNQGNVDFMALKEAGVEFVLLRVGGRYYGSGELYSDDQFESYYKQAKAADLKIGAYFLSQAVNTDEAKEEAQYALKIIGDKTLDYPVAFDWEHIEDDEARTDSVSGDALTAIAKSFCDTIHDAGYKSLIYTNSFQVFEMYDFNAVKDYHFWIADYREFPTMYYQYDMWQYSKEGKIDGIEGNVDMNISFTDFSD